MAVKQDLVEAIEQTIALATLSRAWALQWIGEFDDAEGFRADGASSTSDWLQVRFGIKYQTAREWVRVARALRALPEISKAFLDGRLLEEQVAVLTRFVKADTDYDWAINAQGMSCAQLERHAQRTQRLDREQAAEDAKAREVHLREDPAGRYLRFWGRLPAPEGKAFRQRLEDEVARLRQTGTGGAELGEPYAAQVADALLRLVAGSSAHDRADAPRPEVVIHVTHDALGSSDGVGEVEGSTTVAAETVRRFLCHSAVRTIHWLPDGTLIGVGPATRTPAPWQMRVLWERDGGCAWLGCGETHWVEAHHIVPVEERGPTVLENLMLVCGRHHRALHELGWRVRGSPYEGLEFFKPDGSRVAARQLPRLRENIRERLGIPQSPPVNTV